MAETVATNAEIVDHIALAKYLNEWIEAYRKNRPLDIKPQSQQVFFGALDYLAFHSGLNSRVIRYILNAENPRVPLAHADRILTCAGLNFLLITGDIRIMKNPLWSAEKYAEYRQNRGCFD